MKALDIKILLPELKKLVLELSEDMLQRVSEISEINEGLKNAYEQIEKGGRTAQAYEVWLEDYLDQVAVAWVLACVFVRFMEDNGLIDECWLAGEGERRTRAEDAHTIYFKEHPLESDREYFEHVFHEVGKIPAAAELFAEGKTPLWAVGPTGDAARNLLKFWQEIDTDTGHLKRSFQVENGDTRFLGDLYQDLSERAKKKYALLQTPEFVEEFILDRTLTPAIGEFGIETVRMIDATCGSGHFLLGGFTRLFKRWSKPEHTTGSPEKDVQKALDGVWGVDINPFAVAIARFRLIVAAIQACGITRLKKAPGWKIHIATGDSLLLGSRWNRDGKKLAEHRYLSDLWAPEIYACEDKHVVQEILGQRYHVVVGNPPYINVRDQSLNAAYRQRYATCHQKYSLSVPFAERFFDLCYTAENGICGYVGQITSNAFMKREFGKKLIQEFFPKIDLTHVIDTSGAYIPGHGTPTVILFGRNRKPIGDSVRAVLGIKGEPSVPADPSQGIVWRSILQRIDRVGSQDAFTSSADISRITFNSHPWSIGGGGAAELKEFLEGERETLLSIVDPIGFMAIASEDDVYIVPGNWGNRMSVECEGFATGDNVRDWMISKNEAVVFPYSTKGKFTVKQLTENDPTYRHVWNYRTGLKNRLMFGKTPEQHGMKWYEFMHLSQERLTANMLITFACVSTHNHFVMRRDSVVLNRHAPVVMLRASATDENYIEILGLLNSSTACFWMKQSFHNKGSTVDQRGARQRTDAFEDFYEHTGTGLQRFPLSDDKPLLLARQLDQLGQEYACLLPRETTKKVVPIAERLSNDQSQAALILGQMIALQEELDWHCYQLYGVITDDLRYLGDDLPKITLGQRAFEIFLAQQMSKGEIETTWFIRHGSTPITEIPHEWPEAYRTLVQKRLRLIAENKDLALIERPEYKRRWNLENWEDQRQGALRNWLLDRLESQRYWPDLKKQEATLQTIALLTDKAGGDDEFNRVAALFRGRTDFDLSVLVRELVEEEVVPFLPVLRYKASGIRKRALWERTWQLQREQDAGEAIDDVPVPPKYVNSSGKPDFQTSGFWRLRGSLDVPKERWVSYPHCQRDGDPSLVVGWAGWNHLQQATAIVAYYDARKREGWTAERLKPLLAGLGELLPWIHQWHPEVDSSYGETAGQSFQHLLESDAHELGLTIEEIRSWTPPTVKAARQRKKAKT